MTRRVSRKPKRISQQQITGQQGVNFVERIVLEMGFLWHPTNAGLDAGIDGIIEIRDAVTGDATNNIIQVQVKATTHKLVCSDSATEFTYLCTARDIDYWMNGNTPVVLIAVRPRGDEAYWVNVKEVFSDPTRRADRHLRFDKNIQRFDVSAASAIMKLGVPRDAGLYMPATPAPESLISNLLVVESFPATIYSASTEYRDPQEIFAGQVVMRCNFREVGCWWRDSSEAATISVRILGWSLWTEGQPKPSMSTNGRTPRIRIGNENSSDS